MDAEYLATTGVRTPNRPAHIESLKISRPIFLSFTNSVLYSDFTHELHFDNSTFHADILRASYIQCSSRRKVYILGCDWIGHCEKKVHTSSEWLQIESGLILKHKALCVLTKKEKLLIVKCILILIR